MKKDWVIIITDKEGYYSMAYVGINNELADECYSIGDKYMKFTNITEKEFDKIVDLWIKKINVWNTPNNFEENMKELERLDSQLEMLNA